MRVAHTQRMAPIHISGAGPAGLAAAITLERAGVHAIVHERQNRVGLRFHGDLGRPFARSRSSASTGASTG
jgi:flavin-dependent dehydrogenase